MRSIHLTVPSKTFLVGEYVALKKGPALILSTNPRFELIAQEVPSHNSIHNFHPESPAGKLIHHFLPFFQHYHLSFIDPVKGLGGLGASSAQFVLLYALKSHVQGITINPSTLLINYKKMAWNGKGLMPSGADVMAQIHGEICFFHPLEMRIETFKWLFKDLSYGLIHTGNKLATHKHLQELTHIDLSNLEPLVYQALTSIQQANSQKFIEAIQGYGRQLQVEGLVSSETKQMLKQLSECTNILAAKGCGALGADIILILFDRQKQEEVINWCKNNQFHVLTYGHELAKGLNIA